MGELAQLMEQAWSSMEELGGQLSAGEWGLPTECPGWDVKDQFAHICAIEARLLGRPPAPGGPLWAPQVRNEMGALNERELEARRPLPPERILEEFREVTAERAKVLAAWSEEEWEAEDQGLLGRAPRGRIIAIRIVDVFTHEQDVRVATDRPGHMNGAVARFVAAQMAAAGGFILAKRAGAAEGQTAVFEIGPPGEPFAVGVSGGRGVPLDAIPDAPTVRLAMDGETFLRLTAGRRTPKRVLEEDRVRIGGDRDLAARILAGMNVTP